MNADRLLPSWVKSASIPSLGSGGTARSGHGGTAADALRQAVLRMGLLCVVALTTAGCWDRTEVNDLALVTGVAVDKAGSEALELTVSIAVPSNTSAPGSMGGGESQEADNTTRAAVGRTVAEAITHLQLKTSRRLFWAHNAVLLVGEDYAREGIARMLDFFSRQRQPRLRTPIGVVPGRAADVLAARAPLEQNVPVSIAEIGMLRTGLFVNMLEFLDMLYDDGRQPVAPRVGIVHSGAPEPGMLESGDGGGGGSLGGDQGNGGSEDDPLLPAITGSAIFKGDKLVGFLDDTETRGLLWLRDEFDTGSVTMTLGQSGKWVSVELIGAQTKIEPRFEGDRIIMEVRINAVGDLSSNPADVDAGEPAVITLLGEELAETIAGRVRETFHRVQREFASDVPGFGTVIMRKEPRRWAELRERWDEVFPTVELDLHVRAKIRGTGLVGRPLGLPIKDMITADELYEMLKGK